MDTLATARSIPAQECSTCSLAKPDPARFCARCGEGGFGARLVDGRYAIESELGRGGMGIVYVARDVWLRRQIAIKLIAPALVENRVVAARFCDEARALASVQSRHVVQVFSLGEHEDSYFFAMEYVRGRSLLRILAEHRAHHEKIPVHRALTILARIADGIDAVHAAGIVHRDVKPANIVIEEDTGRPVLLDFGLAFRGKGAEASAFAGTPDYTAPEQTGLVAGIAVGPWTDVYSLGCTAFETLAGRIPYDDLDADAVLAKHARAPRPLVSTYRPELAPFDAVIARAMARSPGERYRSCSEFVAALCAAHELGDRRAAPVARPAVTPFDPNDAALRVLVVDDDPDFRKFATRAVHLAFFRQSVQVIAAASGAAALELVAQRPADLVVLDFDMPGLDGADTLSQIRAMPSASRARVVVVSGRVRPADRWRFSVLGVNDFVAKPTDLTALIETISAVAERAGWREEPREESSLGS
ncbi:MAG: protein kinase [Byssovorax sp.]